MIQSAQSCVDCRIDEFDIARRTDFQSAVSAVGFGGIDAQIGVDIGLFDLKTAILQNVYKFSGVGFSRKSDGQKSAGNCPTVIDDEQISQEGAGAIAAVFAVNVYLVGAITANGSVE